MVSPTGAESSTDLQHAKLRFVTFLTFVRFPLVLLFFMGALAYAKYHLTWLFVSAFTCLVIAAITDIFDGFFARKFNVETRLGAHADPLMDKFFYLATMPLMVFVAAKNTHLPHASALLVLTIFFLARDQWVTFLRSMGSLYNVSGGANWAGKLRTCINYPLICCIYHFEESRTPLINVWLLYTFEAVAFVINLVSLYIYTRHYWPYLRQTLTANGAQSEAVPSRPGKNAFEDGFFQAQKVECLSTMAAGIAHDFNNLLAAILGNIGIVIRNLSPDAAAKNNVEQAELSTLRAIDFSNEIMVFSGKSRFTIEKFNISTLIREMANRLKDSVANGVNIEYKLADELTLMDGDPAQVQQVLMNLVSNASDAIEDGDGTITVSTGIMQCDRAYLDKTYLHENQPEGRYVYMEVSDTGCGITPEIRARMFDPFFTTKIRGRGLGLAIVSGTVRAHGGAINVDSAPKGGSTCRVLFPCESPMQSIC